MIGTGGLVLTEWKRPSIRIMDGVAGAFIAIIVCFGLIAPVDCAEEFFGTLWLPAFWSFATVSLLASCGLLSRVIGIGTLFLPLAATHIHYYVALASHRSFLFAGIFPWGDAYMHFRQAAQMAQDGFATRPFNGRFLYPGFFSSLLRLCSFNMQVAHLAVGAIFTCGLYASVRAILRRTGVAGGSLFTLLLWLYWRDHGACLMMTEQLGVIFGILALPLLLSMTRRRSYALLLGAIFLIAMGFSARPGALFVIPMLVLFAGWVGWSGWIFPAVPSFSRVMVSMFIAAIVSGAGLFSNHLIQTTAFRGTVVPYGNFAYTLNGLLNGTTWEDSYIRYQGNPSLVMEENKALLKEHPSLIVKGIGRAYVRAVSIKFLYSFDSENRLAAISWLFAIAALVFLWRDSAHRDDALWISLFLTGIILSIPFAPPWDAGIRPYAVTVPFQDFLAATGIGFLVSSLAARLRMGNLSERLPEPMVVPAFLLALLVVNLTIILPVIHSGDAASLVTSAHETQGVRFLPGSFVTLDEKSTGLMRSGLSAVFACFRDEGKSLDLLRPGCLIGINWNDLGRYALQPGAVEFKDYGSLKTDVRLLPLQPSRAQ